MFEGTHRQVGGGWQRESGMGTEGPSRRTLIQLAAWQLETALLVALIASAAAVACAQVLMTESEALKVLFPDATWTEEVKTLHDDGRTTLAQSTRLRFGEPSYRFHLARADGQVVGYAVTLDEIGKSEPITFTVGLDAAGKVKDVILLVYRESRGGEVRDRRFLRQFRGKSRGDPIQVDRDILNYSGATLSSKALARGVRKALTLFEHFYPPAARAAGSRSDPGSARSPTRRLTASPGVSGWPHREAASRTTPVHYLQARYLMGTLCAVELYAADREQAARAASSAFDAMHSVDHRMSIYRAESELSRVNHHAAAGPVRVSQELFTVLSFAQRIAAASDGAFDMTVAPLLRAWGFVPVGAETGNTVAGLSRDAARARVGYRNVHLDPAARRVQFARPGVELDLGGIAKGYAVDRAVAALHEWGIEAARVSAGGSTLYALGAPPETPEGWRLVLPTGETIAVRDAAVSSSGHTERFVMIAGRRYSHIFDPRRGEPVSTEVSTVTVSSPTAMESDALTKPFFILSGPEQARLRQHFPQTRVWIGRPGKPRPPIAN